VGDDPNEDITGGSLCVHQQGDPAPGNWVPFSGLAPGLVGVWQINVQIPMATAPGLQTFLALTYNSVGSVDPSQAYRTVINVK
jgi:uncharacterized protein (TIGR03437 family)